MPKSVQINLLNKGDFASTPLGQVLTWILNIGRWIVIFTQLIVIAAFLSRFSLDRQISDLQEIITQKQAISGSFTNFETQFRQTQNRIQSANLILNSQPPLLQILDLIDSSFPSDARLDSVRVDDKELTLTATTLLDQSVDALISNLQGSSLLQNVRLSKISLETKDVYINFEIKATIAPT